jgi:hypothetical protein
MSMPIIDTHKFALFIAAALLLGAISVSLNTAADVVIVMISLGAYVAFATLSNG